MSATVLTGDCRTVLRTLEAGSVHTCVTSPPYFGLRDYDAEGQIGLEGSPAEFVAAMVDVFREVRRVLRDDGTVWLNLGDSYAGSRAGPQGATGQMADRSIAASRARVRNKDARSILKPKDLIGVPWRVAFALQDDGWYLRSDVIWHKPNSMPESVRDRPTSAHEHVFLLSKSDRYFYDSDAVKEPASAASIARISQKNFANQTGGPKDYSNGVNPSRSMRKTIENFAKDPRRGLRNVWSIPTAPSPEPHFAMMPPALAEICIKATCPRSGVVLDPFGGLGTTSLAAQALGRRSIMIELNLRNASIAADRINEAVSGPVTAAESRVKRRAPKGEVPLLAWGAPE